MSSGEQEQFADAASESGVAELSDKLYHAGRISATEHDGLVYAARRDQARKANTRRKVKFTEIDRSLGSRKTSREVQGGLPSLGRRR